MRARLPERMGLVSGVRWVLFPAKSTLVLDGVPANPESESEAPAGHDVDLGGLLGDKHGLALREDDDACHQSEPWRQTGDEAEQDERLVERRPVRRETSTPDELAGPHRRNHPKPRRRPE